MLSDREYPAFYRPKSRSTLLGVRIFSIVGVRSRSCGVDISLLRAGVPAFVQSRLPPLHPLRLDRFERGDALAGDGFQLLPERHPVVGDELGAVARG